MAILGDLLVQGRSRFLQQIYTSGMSIDGDTSITGTLTLSKTQDAAGTANNSPALIVGGPVTGTHLELDNNEIMAKATGTTTADLYINADGGVIYLGKSGIKTQVQGNLQVQGTSTFTGASTHSGNLTVNGTTSLKGTSITSDLAVSNNTKINGTLTVEDEIRTPKWIVDNIANLGGEFIIAPTIVCGDNVSVNVAGPSSNLYTVTVVDSSISSNTFGGIAWSNGSIVKVSGTINDVVLVSINGTMTKALNTDTGSITFTIPSSSVTLTAGTYTGSKVKNLHIMMYKVAGTVPVGIFMTSYGESKYPYIDIYSGASSGSFYSPTTRLGYLTGIKDENGATLTVNGIAPIGWGLYTNNGYFSGTIVSTSGKIGGFNLDTTKIYSGTNSISSTTAGVYLGTDGIRNYNNATQSVTIKNGVITAIGADVSGKITATSGEIGGFTIDSSSIRTKNVAVTSNADNSISLSSTDFTRTINNTSRAGLRFAIGDKFGITGDGTLYANGANITDINASNISTGTVIVGVLPESVKNENIEVGGRNLYLKTGGDFWTNISGGDVANATHTINNDGTVITITRSGTGNCGFYAYPNRTRTVNNSLIVGKTYTLSFDAKASVTGISFVSGASIAEHQIIVDKSDLTLITDWKRFWVTFTVVDGYATGATCFYTSGPNGATYDIRYLKLEEGNITTAWSPAPEDLDVHKYITDIDSNNGITIKPINTAGNDYLQINSSAISFYRNNVETLKLEDSALRVGKVGTNLRNIYITDSEVQIRNNTTAIAKFGSTLTFYEPGTTTVAAEVDSNGINVKVGTFGNATNKITVGTGTSGHSAIRYGMTTLADTTNNGFYIGTDGIALGKGVFKVTAAGALTAKSGSIGKYTITNTYLMTGTGTSATGIGGNQAFWAGNDDSNNAPFRVSYAGALVSTSATITGTINATAGYFGSSSSNGWQIDSDAIKHGTLGSSGGYILNAAGNSSANINGGTRTNLALAIGSKFGVGNDGTLYTNGANITNINANNISAGTLNIGYLPDAVKNENIKIGGKGRWYAKWPRAITTAQLGNNGTNKYIDTHSYEDFSKDFCMRVDFVRSSSYTTQRYCLASSYNRANPTTNLTYPEVGIELNAAGKIRIYSISDSNQITDKVVGTAPNTNIKSTIVLWWNASTSKFTWLLISGDRVETDSYTPTGTYSGVSGPVRLGADSRTDNTWPVAYTQYDMPAIWYTEQPIEHDAYLCFWDLSETGNGTPCGVSSVSSIVDSGYINSVNPFVIGTQTTATYAWTGNCPELSSLKDGQQITYFLPYSSGGTAISAVYTTISSGATTNTTGASLNLTLSGNNSTGQVPIWYGSGMSRVTTHYSYGSVLHLTYRENVIMSGTYSIAAGWFADANYNTDTVYSRTLDGGFITGLNGAGSYSLHMKDANGNWTNIVNQYGTGNAHTVYTGGLKFDEVLYNSTWYTNGIVTTSGTSVSGSLWSSYILDFRYSANVVNTNAGKIIARKPVYLVGTVNSDGLFYLDTTKWWTQTLPTFADGKLYLYIGTGYDWYRINLQDKKTAYIYHDSKIKEYDEYLSDIASQTATNYIKADTNGIKIAMSDPATATTYQHQTASGTTYYVNGLKRSMVSGDGLKVYVGNTAGSETEIASFGETTTIGRTNGVHTIIDSNGMSTYNGDGTLALINNVDMVETSEIASAALRNAATAATAADNAQDSAETADIAANSAGISANTALYQLSVIEDVVGTIDWLSEHTAYVLTTDTAPTPEKTYYTLSGGTYTPTTVADDADPSNLGLYETQVSEAIQSYVANHLALTDDGLWLILDDSSYRMLLSSSGWSVVDSDGETVTGTEVDGNGHVVATLGRLDSLHLTISENRLAFSYPNGESTTEVAWIEVDETTGVSSFHIANAVVMNELRVGSWRWLERAGGNLSLKWINS